MLVTHGSVPRPNNTAKLFSLWSITLHAQSIAAQELNFDIQLSLATQKREGSLKLSKQKNVFLSAALSNVHNPNRMVRDGPSPRGIHGYGSN